MSLNTPDSTASYNMPDGSFKRSGLENVNPKRQGPNMAKAAKLVAKDFIAEGKYLRRPK